MTYKLKPTTNLLDYQLEGVDFISTRKYCGLHDEQGLGKTLQSLAFICKAKKKALIVAPPFLLQNIRMDSSKFTELNLRIWDHKKKTIDKEVEVYLIGYTQLKHAGGLFDWADIVICDESQYLKNLDAKRTQYFFELFRQYKPQYYISLSGTPMKNRVPDLYPFLVLMGQHPGNPDITKKYDTLYKFCVRFTNIGVNNFGGMTYSGVKNTDELLTYLKPVVLRRKAEDVLTLPEMKEVEVIASYKEDRELEKTFDVFNHNFVTADIEVKVESACLKADFTADYIKNLDFPIVVFSDHKKPLNIIQSKLSKYKFDRIDGEVPMSKRTEIVKKFQNGKIDILLATIGSSSVGLNLQRANTVVFNDISWVPSDIEQAKKRVHRIGQERESRVIYVIGSKADEYILRSIRSKMEVIDQVVEYKEKPKKKKTKTHKSGGKIWNKI